MAFSSWRTLPGHAYAISGRIASCDTVMHRAARFAAELLEEVLHEQRDVLAALAQRRQRESG